MLRLQPPLPEGYTIGQPDDLARRIAAAKATLGSRLMILGHHYQRDEVMRWADARGDSFGLSRLAADNRDAEFVVFCGVHFMAESADVLTGDHQQVILPDLNAGCSMADMADLDSVEEAWEAIAEVTDIDAVVPITYMNSSAALKAFVGRHGGAVCTSSNARAVLTWALGEGGRATKVLFFPDQHLGRNTGFQLGYTGGRHAGVGPPPDLGGLDEADVKEATLPALEGPLLGPPALPARARRGLPGRAPRRASSSSTPSAAHEVVELADQVGSTDFIIKAVDEAPAGSVIGIGTEIHLVQRLAAEHPDKTVVSLDPLICPCSTMFRIDAAHLCWVLEELVAGRGRQPDHGRRRRRPSGRGSPSSACSTSPERGSQAEERRQELAGVALAESWPPSRACPSTTTRPPPSPPSGPRSMIQSAVLMTSRLCSMTSTRVALIDQPGQHGQELADVLEVQAGRRLVEEVDGVAGGALGQLAGQLDPLGLAPRQRRGRLAQADVAEPDVHQRLHVAGDDRLVGEELERLLAGQVEHLGDVLALERDVQRVPVVAGALAHLARHVDVRQEVHLDLDRPVAGAGLAAAAA